MEKANILWVGHLEEDAKRLCEANHNCPDPSDHDCKDWLTYPEAERHEARETVAARQGN